MIKLPVELTYIGETDFGCPAYRSADGRIFANPALRYGDPEGLYSLSGNSLEGEPLHPVRAFYSCPILLAGEPDPREHLYKGDYMFLSRLQSDCEYFLGYGNRTESHLWAGSVKKQIAKMKEVWEKFPCDLKPEWLTLDQINAYEAEMAV